MMTGGMTRLRSVPWMLGAPCLHRLFGVEDGGQHLILDLDQIQRLLGMSQLETAATAATPSPRKRTLSAEDVLVVDQRAGAWLGLAGVRHVRHIETREDGRDARQALGPAGVDADDAGVGVRAAHHGRMQHARQRDDRRCTWPRR